MQIQKSSHEISDISFILNHINNENFQIKMAAMKILKAHEDNNGFDLKTLTNNIEFPDNIDLIKAS